MKIAIIGVLNDLAQKFIHSLPPDQSKHEFVLVDFVQPAPIVEFADREYLVQPYTQELLESDIDLAICFGEADRKSIVLELEDKQIKTIDLTGSFVDEPTVPLVLFDQAYQHSGMIMALPSIDLHVYGPILQKLHQRFTIRRIALTAFTPAEEVPRFFPDKMTEEEMALINESLRLMDNNQVHFTAAICPLLHERQTTYHLNIEFVRPFNMDGIREVLSAVDSVVLRDQFRRDTDLAQSIIVNRIRRDFSADSAIHLNLSAEDPQTQVFKNIQYIMDHLNS